MRGPEGRWKDRGGFARVRRRGEPRQERRVTETRDAIKKKKRKNTSNKNIINKIYIKKTHTHTNEL